MADNIHKFTRSELYNLVWSEPMIKLAKRFGISDVALAKACRRIAVPVPERGYWARRQAGRSTVQRPLPPRGPGMQDEVTVGGRRSHAYGMFVGSLADQELPPPPSFEEDIGEVAKRVRKMVGKVTVPKTLAKTHPSIERLLEEDERRREKQAALENAWSWERPLFDSALERRRLRILNAIFLASVQCGMRPSMSGNEARDLGLQVGDTHVSFMLDRIKKHGRPSSTKDKKSAEMLRFQIISCRGSERVRKSWEDSGQTAIEQHITDIVIDLIVDGEVQYRESVEYRYQWLVKRKAELEEQARREKEEEERQERERILQEQKARVDRLLNEAAALRQAVDIRAYVDAVRTTSASVARLPQETIEAWATWALTEADRIDPILSGRFLEGMKGRGEG